MAAMERFKDVKTWQVARELPTESHELLSHGPSTHDRGLRNQIKRDAVSVGASVAKGFDGQGNAEFMRFPGYAIRLATKLQLQLHVILNQTYISSTQSGLAHEMAAEAKNLLHGFKRYLRNHRPLMQILDLRRY